MAVQQGERLGRQRSATPELRRASRAFHVATAGTLLRGSDIAQLLKEVAGAAAELLEAESGGGFAVSDAA